MKRLPGVDEGRITALVGQNEAFQVNAEGLKNLEEVLRKSCPEFFALGQQDQVARD
jgi:aminoglycoside phosphotransferase